METSPLSNRELLTQHTLLRQECKTHKSQLRQHREQLQTKTARLVALERECHRRGIRLITQEQQHGAHSTRGSAD